jgi:hypothetical protein
VFWHPSQSHRNPSHVYWPQPIVITSSSKSITSHSAALLPLDPPVFKAASAKSFLTTTSRCEPAVVRHKWSSYKVGQHWLKFVYTYGIARICVLPLLAKKVDAVSSTEAFPMVGFTLQVTLDNTQLSSFSTYPKYVGQFEKYTSHKLMWDASFSKGWRIDSLNVLHIHMLHLLFSKQLL